MRSSLVAVAVELVRFYGKWSHGLTLAAKASRGRDPGAAMAVAMFDHA